MIAGFIIWSAAAVAFLVIGIICRRSKEPAGFFTGVKPPEMKDTAAYNRALSKLWFVSAVILEVMGIPLLFSEQNAPQLLLIPLLAMLLVIGMAVAYWRIERKYKK